MSSCEHEPDPASESCLTAHLDAQGQLLPACVRCKKCREWCRPSPPTLGYRYGADGVRYPVES